MLSPNHLFGFVALALVLASGPGEAASRALVLPDRTGDPPRAETVRSDHVILAQASDPRIMGLEEEIRRLNGRLEELNFQILQMQDQMRRLQEDTEFRFQELENGPDGETNAPDQRTERREPARPADQGTAAATEAPADSLPGVEMPPRGEPPRTLGTITFDENGNVVSSGGDGRPIDLLQGTPAADGGATVAALPPADNPDEAYRNAYEFILSGDYRTAEAGFRQYLDRFPDGEDAADANFWLGEALLAQDSYREAAETFLQANRSYPDAKKAPEMLLKLGVSLAALDQRDVACATFTEIGHRYPDISSALQERVKQEQALAGC